MNKIRIPAFFLFVFTSLMFLEESCVNHEVPYYTCPPEAISFTTDVQPIIVAKCAITACHNGDGNPDGPGVDRNWNNFDMFQEHAREGLVKTYVVNRIMPLSSSTAGPLSEEQIAIIACWIDQGAQAN